jgi:hypothetical protein
MTHQQLSLGTTRDWRERLCRELEARGFSSATGYADSQPLASLPELANSLGADEIAAMQLEERLVEEAEGNGTMERCARSLLARDLRQELPEGWQREWNEALEETHSPLFRKTGVFSSLTMALPELYAPATERIRKAMDAATIPLGWLPDGADDPILVAVFDRHWLATT